MSIIGVLLAFLLVPLVPIAAVAQQITNGGALPTINVIPDLSALSVNVRTSDGHNVQVVVPASEWGVENTRYAMAVVQSVVFEFGILCPQTTVKTLVLRHIRNTSPTNNTTNSEGTIWASANMYYYGQLCFQCSHEYCHILARSWIAKTAKVDHNQWFDEAICECASLVFLQRVGHEWVVTPPLPGFAQYGHLHYDYYRTLVSQKYCLPRPVSLADWYRHHHRQLETDWPGGLEKSRATMPGYGGEPYITDSRARARLVANRLYRLFEKYPDGWKAVPYLHTNSVSNAASFQEFLTAWCTAVPGAQKGFFREIATQFGLTVQ